MMIKSPLFSLARHYGLSDEELDFIMNYDVEYRMSASTEGDGRGMNKILIAVKYKDYY